MDDGLLNGELLMLHSSYCKLLLIGIVHIRGGDVYLMKLILLTMFCEYGFEGLIYEMK